MLIPSILVPRRVRPYLLRSVGVKVGGGVSIGAGLRFIHGNLTLGDDVSIGHYCFIDDEAPVIVGGGATIGPYVKLLSVTHEIGAASHRGGERHLRTITIGPGTWVGAGVTVLAGVTIGKGCVIGAGAVVTADCDPDGVYAGVPAVRLRDLD